MLSRLLITGVALGVLGTPALAASDYARAEQFLSHNLNKLVYGRDVKPKWMPDGRRFWYSVKTRQGPQYMLVDPARNSREPLFDNARMAAAMIAAVPGATYESNKLNLADFKVKAEHQLTFQVDKKLFECDRVAYRCAAEEAPEIKASAAVLSPDRRWEALIRDYNLFVRPADGGEEIQLTTDGTDKRGYGKMYPIVSELRSKGAVAYKPVLSWSPDSRKVAIIRWNYEGLKTMPLYSSTTVRPTPYSYPYSQPGDDIVERFDIHIIEVASKGNLKLDMESIPVINDALWYVGDNDRWQGVKWSPDSKRLYFNHTIRGARQLSWRVADAVTGKTRTLISESSDKTTLDVGNSVQAAPPTFYSSESDLFWFSWRDGWGHIYRYDGEGTLKNQVTAGPWTVRAVEYIDHKTKTMYFSARGMDPKRFINHNYIYRINFDGTGLKLLTPEDADHQIDFSPDGRYFVDRYSREDLPPIAVLRQSDSGKVLRELERADIKDLLAIGWKAPEFFEAVSPDGFSRIYARVYKPSNFDPNKVYPIVNYIYPVSGGSISSWGFSLGEFQDDLMEKQAIAELGFVVIAVTGRGTRYRSKAFLDAYQGKMGENTIPEHIAAIKQYAGRHPWVDINKVGVYGLSGGGFASTAAILRYPDFYKVAVSINGNHDNRTYGSFWGEKYQGPFEVDPKTGKDNYEREANYMYAKNLKGKLMLVVGDLDENVHPSNTFRVVHALIEANKRFDLMVYPDRGHGIKEPHSLRLTWDYFVRNLKGEEPPEYTLSSLN